MICTQGITPAEPSLICIFREREGASKAYSAAGSHLASGSGGNYQNLKALVDSSVSLNAKFGLPILRDLSSGIGLGWVDPSYGYK